MKPTYEDEEVGSGVELEESEVVEEGRSEDG